MSAKRISPAEILIWIFVLLLVVVVASPFALGFKIKTDYSALTQKISDMMQIDLSIVKYDRGYFSSDVTMDVQIPGVPASFQFKEKIIHGPVYLGLINQGKSPFVAAVIKGELLPAEGFEELIEHTFSGQSALVYQNIIDFAGNVESESYMPSVSTVIEQDTGPLIVQSSGVLIAEYYSALEEKLSGEMSLKKFLLSSDDITMDINNLNVSFSGMMGANDLLMGDSVLSFDKLNMQSTVEQFTLRNFSVSSVSSEVGALINSQVRVNAQELLLSNQKLGPIIFALGINGLNAGSINQLTQMRKDMDAKAKQGIPAEQINAMLLGQMMGILPDLFKQAVITIDPFSMKSELGSMEASLDFSVDGLDQNSPADPMFLLKAVNLEVDLGVDEPLLKQLVEWQLAANESQISPVGSEQVRKIETSVSMEQKVKENLKGLTDENWLVLENEKYSTNIKLQQGLMSVNDKFVDPMEQIMSQMSSPPAVSAP